MKLRYTVKDLGGSRDYNIASVGIYIVDYMYHTTNR